MTPKPTALVVRHLAFEHLGSFAGVLLDRGFNITMLDAGVDPMPLAGQPPELLIVLGGPIGATDEADYPFILDELRLIERQIGAGLPILGICLGAQMIARVLGARVYAGEKKEIGWSALTPTDAGVSSCLAPLSSNDWHVLHWHGDTFDLPRDARLLASTDNTFNQAFSIGDNILGLQFHIEVMVNEIERWLIGHTVEITAAGGLEIARLRADSARWGPGLARLGPACLGLWLDEAMAAKM